MEENLTTEKKKMGPLFPGTAPKQVLTPEGRTAQLRRNSEVARAIADGRPRPDGK